VELTAETSTRPFLQRFYSGRLLKTFLFSSTVVLVQGTGGPPGPWPEPAASGRRCAVDGRETTTEELVVFQINFYSNNVSVN